MPLEDLQSLMPLGRMIASAGDVVHSDSAHLLHRCSAARGMSGGGIRILEQPHALTGIHLRGLSAHTFPFSDLALCFVQSAHGGIMCVRLACILHPYQMQQQAALQS